MYAALKARPLCDALARLEEALYETFDDAYWADTYGETTIEQFIPAFEFYQQTGGERQGKRHSY